MALTLLPAIVASTDDELDVMAADVAATAPAGVPLARALDGLLADLMTLPDGLRSRVRADLLIVDVLLALGWPAAAVARLGLPTDERMAA